MNLVEHLEHIIGLVERGEPLPKIKASLVAMSEEVSGYQQAATKAITLTEKQLALDAPRADQFVEMKKQLAELKRDLEIVKNKPSAVGPPGPAGPTGPTGP